MSGQASVAGMIVDISLCFVALLLAASTLTSRYMSVHTAVPELPLILFGATAFSLVMALMYALFGLYRPKPISVAAASWRTLVALCLGGYLTALAMRVVADRGYIEQLIPAAHRLSGDRPRTDARVLLRRGPRFGIAPRADRRHRIRRRIDRRRLARPRPRAPQPRRVLRNKHRANRVRAPRPRVFRFFRRAHLSPSWFRDTTFGRSSSPSRSNAVAACRWTSFSIAAFAVFRCSTSQGSAKEPRRKSRSTASKAAGSSTARVSSRDRCAGS